MYDIMQNKEGIIMNKKYNLYIVILSFILLINGCFQIERNEKFNFVAMSLVLVIGLIIIFVINNIHEFIINNDNEIKNIKYILC